MLLILNVMSALELFRIYIHVVFGWLYIVRSCLAAISPRKTCPRVPLLSFFSFPNNFKCLTTTEIFLQKCVRLGALTMSFEIFLRANRKYFNQHPTRPNFAIEIKF